jgi:sialidase-1
MALLREAAQRCLLLPPLLLSLVAVRAAPPVTVFERGEAGYFCVKIPSLLYLESGDILAFGEARMHSCADTAWTDLVMKRSRDNGTTWSALQVVYANSSLASITQIGNAAPLQLRESNGTILVPFCVNNSDVYLTRSTDDGTTWSPPRHLPGLVRTMVTAKCIPRWDLLA